MSNPHGQPNKSRSLRSRHQISGVRQPVRVVVPPSQSFGALNGFTDSVREVSFGDSVDGFPLYVDEDGVMKISGHRQHDPFVFGYDAVEENDFSVRGGRRGGPARRNTYRTNHNVDSESFSNGTLTSDRYTSSLSSHEEYYHPSKQHRSQLYGYGHPYGIEADLAAGYEHQQPAGLQYRGGSGIVAAYDDDGAPVPIDAALLRHHYVASRRRRLVGVGSNVHARSRAKRPGARRKRGKPTQGGGSGSGGRLGLRSTLSTASPHTSSGRRGDSREVRGPGGLPSRLSGSDSFLLGSKTFLNTLGGASAAAAAAAAASASAAAASGIPSGFSAILSASTLVNVGPSSLKKAARAREYFLAREGEVKRRYAALRRRDARSASTGVATKGDSDAQKPAVSGTSHAEAYSRAGDGAGFAASNSDALTSHLTRFSRPSSLLRVSLETCDRIMGLNAGKAGAGTGFALATARSARSPAKGTPHQLHAVATAEEAVYVREGPASAVAAEATPSHGNGVAGTNGAPGTMRDTKSAPVKAIHFEQGMVTLHDLYTGLPIASAYVPVTKSVGPAAAVHTCAAGIQFFRDPTAPRSSAIQLLTQASSALPGSTSQLLPTAYMLGDIDAPFAPNHAATSPVPEETPLYACLPERLTQPTTHAASFASAAHCRPSFPQPPAISPTWNATSQLRPIQCPCCDTVDEVTFDSRTPRSRGMGGPLSAVSPIVRGLRGRDAVVSAEKEVTVVTDLSPMVRHTRTNTAAFDMVYPGLAACDRHAAADTLPTAASSGGGCRMSLNFGDSTRPQSGLQSGLTPGIESHITTAAPAAEVDIGGGADSFSWRGRYGVLESGSGSRGFQAGVEVAAPLKRDEAACGWYGVWPPVFHGPGAPGKHTIRLSTPGVSSSLFTATPSSPSQQLHVPLPVSSYSPSLASYPASHHLQHNIRYNAWTAEGVSATSNTSCVVHVFTVSREMLRSVYEYVAYMCVAKRHAELQQRRRTHEKRLRKELAASGLTSAPQRCLRCPHCSIVGQVVRYAPLKRDSPTVESSALFETQAQSPHLPHGERHHRHRYPDHSRTSRTSSLMSNTATATTTTPPPVEDPPQRLRTLLLQQRQQSSHLGMECVPTRGSGGHAAATLTLRRKEKTRLASSWPQDDLRTVGLATDRGPKSFSSFRLCDRVAVPPLAQTSSSSLGVAVEDICDKTPERQSSVRALLVNEVDTVPVAPPVSALPHSSASAPALRASRRPMAATGGSASGSFSALPPLAQSVLPSQLQTGHSSSGFHQLSTSGAALAQLSPTSLSQQQPLLTSTTASVASLSLARLHPPSRVSSTQWTALAATNNSSGSRAETLLDSSVVSGDLSQSFRLRSPLRDLSVGVADRYTAPSSNDLRASRQQQPATTALARGADDTRLTNEAVAAVSTLENVEECGGATGEDAAERGLSSRVELVDSTSPRYSLYVGDMSSDVDDRRSDHAALVPPHASSYPEQPIRMATGAHDLRVTCSTSAAQFTQVSSTDSPFLKDAPTAAPNGATTPTNAFMAALKANMKATRGGLRGNPNARSVSGATTLLGTMAKSAPTPLSVRESANDEDDVVVRKRLRDTDAQVAAQDGGDGVWYVCHSCHHDVIPKRSLLTSAGGNPSSCRPSQNTPPQAPARSIPDTSSDTSSDVGEAYLDDDEADDNLSADAGVMAFEDLLQDDALVHALHTSLCESLMMPSTREPPPLFPTSPPDTTQKRFATTSSVRTNMTDPLPLASLVEPPHPTDVPSQLSPVSISMEAAEAPAKAPRNPTSPMKAPSSSSSSSAVPHPKGPAVRRSGGVVGSEGIGGGNIGDNQDGITEQQREILTSPLSNSAAPASLSTLSTPVSPQRLSEALGSDAVMGADGAGNGSSAALSRIRLSLPCCGLTVSVLPHEESLLPTAMPSGSAGGSERRGLTGRPLTRTGNASHKHVVGVRSQRQRSSTSGWRPRPPIPRMREDAATRGLTPSAMLTSSAASSHRHDKRDDKKESQRRPHNMRETSRCPRRRHNIVDTAAERPSVSVASSLDEQVSPNAAATATTMAPIIKGTFSSEKHRIQVNPRTPLDAVSKKRIIERIFHQNWLSSSDGRTTNTTTSVPAEAAVTTAAASRTGDGECGSSLSDKRNGEGPASSAAAAPADHQGLTSVVERPSGGAAKADAPVSALGSGMHVRRHRRRRHVLSYTQEQAQHNADLLSPPSRVPTPLGVDLGVYRDSSLVLEIDLAYPRLPRGNVRELLAEWKDTCQPHPALVEAVIRNIIYSVLVQLLDLHATGRAHGSVKSTNAFPLWHAMESTRESGLVMPPPARRRAKSRAPSIGARKESATRLGRGQQAEAKTPNVDDNGRRPSNCDIEGKDAGEAASTPAAPLSVQSQAGRTPQEYASKGLASRTLAAAAVETGATSSPKPRLDSESQPRRARHAGAGHLRPHQQMRPRHHQARRLNMAIRETGGVAGVPNKTNGPASATLCEMTSLATPIDALSNGLATAMGANPCRSDSLSAGSGAGTKLHTTVSQSQPSTTPSSPSAVLSTASAPHPGLQSRGGASADSWRPGATPLFSVDNISTSTAFSPLVSMTSSNTRLCGGGSAAARLRRGSLATGDGGDDDADDPNGDDVVEDDRMLVPLVAEVLTPPCAVLRGTTTTKAAAAAAAGVGTTGSQTEFQNSLGATPCYSSPAAPPRHRSEGHSPLQSCRRSGSWSAALEDPHAWLASAVPRRFVRGVEMGPPAAVWCPSPLLNKFGVKGGKPYGIHHAEPSADTGVASERTSGAAAELVLTRGPTGAVPHPQLGDAGKEAASAHATASANRARRRRSSTDPSTGSPAALHGVNDSAGQDAPDPLQWSRQVLLVDNIASVVATALRTAMTCVLLQRQSNPHRSHLSFSAAFLNSAPKAKVSRSGKVRRVPDAVAVTDTRSAQARSLRPADSTRSAARASYGYVPDVVHSPPPLPPTLFAIEDSEYVPAPELIRLSADEARSLRRLWYRRCGDAASAAAAAAVGVKNERESGECFGMLHSSTMSPVDAETEDGARLRKILAWAEATESPATTLRNILDPSPSVSAAVDVWQLGMMALELADGPSLTTREPVPALRVYPWSSYFHSFVSLCLQRAPEKRGTVAELLQHPWFSVALLPQASSTLLPTTIQTSGAGWGTVDEPVEATKFAASRQGGMVEGTAPMRSTSLAACAPGVMGVECLTPEEKAEWEGYDYTLLYASRAQLNHPLATATAAASAAVADVEEHHHQGDNPSVRGEGLPTHKALEDTSSSPEAATVVHDSHTTDTTNVMSIPGASSTLGRQVKRSIDTLLSQTAAAATVSAHSSALTLPSGGGRTAVALPPTAASVITPSKASADGEMMSAMCTVDLAQSFAELIAQQWVLQQQQRVSSLVTGAGTYSGVAKGRHAMSLLTHNYFTPASAAAPLDGVNQLYLPAIPTRSTTSTGEATAAYSVLPPHLAQPSTVQGAMSRRRQQQQQQPVLLFSQTNHGERLVPMWRGHGTTLGNHVTRVDPVAVIPVTSSSGSPSPLLLTPRDFFGGGGGGVVRVLPNPSQLMYAPPRVASADLMVAAANDLVPRWTARVRGQWDGMEGMPSQPPSQQTPSSTAHNACSPCSQLNARGEGGCSAKYGDRSGLGNDGNVGGASSGSEWHYDDSTPQRGRREQVVSGSSSGRSSTSSMTQSDSDSDSFALSPPADDTTDRGVAKAGAARRRGGGNGNIMFSDPTTGFGGAVVLKEGVYSASSSTAVPAPLARGSERRCRWRERIHSGAGGDGVDDHNATPPPFSSSPPTRRLLNGTIATALARLSRMAYLPSDSEDHWGGTSSSSSNDGSTSFSDESDSATGSPVCGVPAYPSAAHGSYDMAPGQQNCPEGGDAIGCKEPREDEEMQSIGAEVLCDELLRCTSAIQRSCPAAVSFWCVRMLQQAMRHPRTTASAARILQQIEGILPAERKKNAGWLKQPDSSLSLEPLSTVSDALGAGGAQCGQGAAVKASDGSFSPAAVGLTNGSYPASGAFLLPAELDASPSSFQNYEVAKWIYALHQALPRCT
ncbi:hypothetical protein JKF63_04263 [Porcisia hertigi]|uniref:Uncharacterized protein n=1 Tax=Porcisia hertigi TaxID=2761500 RepID=A0A836IBD3_9TRYP|nr:hypothetical protein JKF63_04263 [Porcisia hertigi]